MTKVKHHTLAGTVCLFVSSKKEQPLFGKPNHQVVFLVYPLKFDKVSGPIGEPTRHKNVVSNRIYLAWENRGGRWAVICFCHKLNVCECVCLFVCVLVCPPPPRSLVNFGNLGPLGTFWIPWTYRYHLDTLDL